MQDQSARPALALAGVADGSSLIPAFANSTRAACFGRPRHRRIVPHQVLRNRAVDQQRQLGRKPLGILGAELIEEIAKPQPPALLEGDRDLLHGLVLGAELGDRVDERATAKILRRETPFQRIEGAEDLVEWRFVGWRALTKRRVR